MNLCENILNKLSKHNLDQFEVYGLITDQLSIQMEKNSIKDFTNRFDLGVAIRIIKDKRIGFSFFTSFNDEDIDNIIKRTLKFTKIGKPDPDFEALPSPKKYNHLNNLSDPKVKNLDPELIIENLNRIAFAANKDEKVYSISAGVSKNLFHEVISNSNGISVNATHSLMDLFCSVTTKEGGNTGSSFDFQSARFLKEIEPEKVGNNAAELSLKSLRSKQLKTRLMPVIFHPIASSIVLGSGIGNAINAESVQYQQSYLTDKLEEKLFNLDINIYDNGIYIKNNGIPAIGSSVFDAEGYPTQKTIIFNKGVLKNYIHNSYTANKEKVENTGNASRNGYNSSPSISTNNMVFETGNDGKLEDLISETKKGIILYYTGDTPNIITGDFSALIHTGFYIEDGEIKYGIKDTMIGINMLDFFKNLDLIGSKIESIGKIHIPPLRISNIKISGS